MPVVTAAAPQTLAQRLGAIQYLPLLVRHPSRQLVLAKTCA
jgi:hypothetical protein